MKKSFFLLLASFIPALSPIPQAFAQNETLHVVRSSVNAETENAELCLEFDRPLAPASLAHLGSVLHLAANGKTVTPPNIAATDSNLCLFPLERGADYRIDIKGLRGANEEPMEPYTSSFSVPDRAPSLVLEGVNGDPNAFNPYDKPLILHSVNVTHATLGLYRVTDTGLSARAWQNRSQIALAPSESATLVRDKGHTIWREEENFSSPSNVTAEEKILLKDKLPDLAPGLYLLVADAGNIDQNQAEKGMTPLGAAWVVRSDFSLRALRDTSSILALASSPSGPKTNIHISALNKQAEQIAEADIGANGIGTVPYSAKFDKNDLASLIGTDPAGNIAFADVQDLPAVSSHFDPGVIHASPAFAAPLESVGVVLSPPATKKEALSSQTLLRVLQNDFVYTDLTIPPSTSTAKVSFSAPAMQGKWTLRWQTNDGTVLAEAPLLVTSNPDAPHLEASADRDALGPDGNGTILIKSLTTSGKPMPLVNGRVLGSWKKVDAPASGWDGYHFGTPAATLENPKPVATFVTDLEGEETLHFSMPALPKERGLYQAVLQVASDSDSGVMPAAPLVLPLHPEEPVVGIKPLADKARFATNSAARFALVALSPEGKPRALSDLSYQVYEQGRSFEWYQDEGRWKYKPESQLRPIGGGSLSIDADATSVIEWPVATGNYRLEILDQGGKILAQSTFSAGWDSAGPTAQTAPLNVTLSKTLQPGREAVAHVTLPEAALLTAIVSDGRIRSVVHEMRPAGDNTIVFTPAPDWLKTVSVDIDAVPQKPNALLRTAFLQASLTQTEAAKPSSAGASVLLSEDPSALLLRKDDSVTLTFGIENDGPASETYHYAFTGSPGLKIEDAQGTLSVDTLQSKSFSISLHGATTGPKELRLEVTGSRTPRFMRNWPMAILSKNAFLRTGESTLLAAHQNVLPAGTKPHSDTFVLLSRHPMNGLAEILTYVFNAHPFTTQEYSLTLDALRQWSDTLDRMGIAPDFLTAAREQKFMTQLLAHQNRDGGFGAWRGEESTMGDTAFALTSLASSQFKQADAAKKLAISWLKQQLDNTWFEEEEREQRAAAYAALAAADALDPASLHYFSDTSAGKTLPALAGIHLAAAFKHIHDPDAAAFWIKKMLDENGGKLTTLPLLNALAATDALSSDNVLEATSEMASSLRANKAPEIKDAAALLSVIAVNNANAGKARVVAGNDTRTFSGVLAVRSSEASNLRNDSDPLYATPVSEAKTAPVFPQHGLNVARHIYRLNGVELSPPARPLPNEIYMVELKGEASASEEDAPILLQDGGNGLRPMGCPLAPQLETVSVVPWLTPHSLSTPGACELSGHEIHILFFPEANRTSFSTAYFARIDADSTADIPAPRVHFLRY